MNRAFRSGKPENLYRGYESKYPKYRDTEAKIYISRRVSRNINEHTASLVSQMINGLTNELIKFRP